MLFDNEYVIGLMTPKLSKGKKAAYIKIRTKVDSYGVGHTYNSSFIDNFSKC